MKSDRLWHLNRLIQNILDFFFSLLVDLVHIEPLPYHILCYISPLTLPLHICSSLFLRVSVKAFEFHRSTLLEILSFKLLVLDSAAVAGSIIVRLRILIRQYIASLLHWYIEWIIGK